MYDARLKGYQILRLKEFNLSKVDILYMMQGPFMPMANSTVSPDTLQTRYEKAIKQINKLIEINREIKEVNSHL